MTLNKKNYIEPNKLDKYNQFLISLDKREETSKKIINEKVFQDNEQGNSDDENKKLIDLLIKNIRNDFSEILMNSEHVSGQRLEDNNILKNEWKNPNIYKENCINTNTNKSYRREKYYSERQTINSPIIKRKEIKVNKNVLIDVEVNNINDILNLIEKYDDDASIKYNINMNALHKIKEPLIELNNMIGMNELKNNIVEQIIYFVQNLHVNKDMSGDFMHTVIYGPPGTGKTEVAKLIGTIYSKIGILDKGTFKKVTRSDLIAGYLGQTALKTRDVIKESLGGVLFIDEAYSLGNIEKRDSFSKECIDTLCESLSDYKSNLMVIIAGYEKDLKECFFNYNQGLDSRFTWRFKIDDYEGRDLYNIFLKKVKDNGWFVHENSKITVDWFHKHKDYFPFFGRDIETLLAKTKIVHSKRVFCKSEDEKKKLILIDLEKGFELFIKNNDSQSKKEVEHLKKQLYSSIYC
jgi:ATP-dependent 26S proteasome regulatory subunit